MRALALLLAVLLAGCGSVESLAVRETPGELETLARGEEPAPTHGDRSLGHLRGLWTDHLEDSTAGLEFTLRCIQREIRRDWDRVAGFFD